MSKPVIAGVAMTRFGKFLDTPLKDLASEACVNALKDAGLAPGQVDMVMFGNGAAGLVNGQEMIRGQVALRGLPLGGVPLYNLENACASGAAAVDLACMAIQAGRAEVVLVCGAEKLNHPDKKVSANALANAADPVEMEERRKRSKTGAVFMDLYAEWARDYMEASGATAADYAAVTVKSRALAANSPYAQFTRQTTVEEVLAERMIADPLTLSMCSGMGDGAAAVIVMSQAKARELGLDCVKVLGSALVSAIDEDGVASPAERSTKRAYEIAGIDPTDLDVVELHDASSPSELILYEKLGLCAAGEGPRMLRDGLTLPTGKVAVNSGGGLLSRGHPVGATGVAQVVEVVNQLRGRAGKNQKDGARLGLAQNQGGYIRNDAAVSSAIVLER